jgi:transposase
VNVAETVKSLNSHCHGHDARGWEVAETPSGKLETQALFACLGCDYENNADHVGAMNILARGYRVIACGEDGSGSGRKTAAKPASMKQEPTDATGCEVPHA